MACHLAISSMSLGRCFSGHSLAHKLSMAAKYGYRGVEIFYEDLVDLAQTFGTPTTPTSCTPSPKALLSAAQSIHSMCAAFDLAVVSLQPFMHYEGLVDREEHVRRIHELRLWLRLAAELHTDLILIPSSFLPSDHVSDSVHLMAADLREAADLAAAADPPVRLCYESLCWGTRLDTWEASWEMVALVDRPNFGLCLDTFNIAGRVFADPSREGGKAPNAEAAVAESMARLVAQVGRSRVFLVQVVDAEKLESPLVPGHDYYDAAQPCRMSWSRNCRLFYGECGAYLPVREISRAIFRGVGYEGWVSLELFNKRMSEEDPQVPEELARRGAKSWRKLVTDVGIKVEAPVRSAMISPSL